MLGFISLCWAHRDDFLRVNKNKHLKISSAHQMVREIYSFSLLYAWKVSVAFGKYQAVHSLYC